VIAPRTRLLLLVAVVLGPASLIPVAAPAWWPVFALCIIAVLGAAALDAAASYDLLRTLKATVPPVVRLSKDTPGQIDIRLSDPRYARRPLRLALPLDETFVTPDQDTAQPTAIQQLLGRAVERFHRPRPQEGRAVRLSPGQAWSVVAWPCTPSRRGQFALPAVHVERPSFLGLWSVRRHIPVACQLRVYPNLLAERRHVAALFLNRGDYGSHVTRAMGKGREFEKLREYVPGDGYDEMHWKATARRGKPITKVFQIERTQEVYVLIDASRLSAREVLLSGSTGILPVSPTGVSPVAVGPEQEHFAYRQGLHGRDAHATHGQDARATNAGETPASQVTIATTLERYLHAALVMAMAAQRQGDLYGTLAFSNTIDAFVRSRGGHEHFKVCRDALYTLAPKLVSPDYAEMFSFVRLHLRRRALLIVLTSLDDPVLSESFARHVGLVARKHLVMVNMIRPPAAEPLFSSPVARTSDIYRNLAGHFQWHRLRELHRHLQRQGVALHQMESETLCTQLVSQYMQVKRKQLL